LTGALATAAGALAGVEALLADATGLSVSDGVDFVAPDPVVSGRSTAAEFGAAGASTDDAPPQP
jgi:hypothetical protein